MSSCPSPPAPLSAATPAAAADGFGFPGGGDGGGARGCRQGGGRACRGYCDGCRALEAAAAAAAAGEAGERASGRAIAETCVRILVRHVSSPKCKSFDSLVDLFGWNCSLNSDHVHVSGQRSEKRERNERGNGEKQSGKQAQQGGRGRRGMGIRRRAQRAPRPAGTNGELWRAQMKGRPRRAGTWISLLIHACRRRHVGPRGWSAPARARTLPPGWTRQGSPLLGERQGFTTSGGRPAGRRRPRPRCRRRRT